MKVSVLVLLFLYIPLETKKGPQISGSFVPGSLVLTLFLFFFPVRQKRRQGEDVYDLKAVCKIRDPWPQPWIKVKNRRGLGGLIETKVSITAYIL